MNETSDTGIAAGPGDGGGGGGGGGSIGTNNLIAPVAGPRESVIMTAIQFLQNANVKRSPLNLKQNFLRSKGLTENEIQIACEKAGVFTIDPNSTVINIDTTAGAATMASSSSSAPPVNRTLVRNDSWMIRTFMRMKEIAGTAAFIAGITYAIYLFYKKYIQILLFGKRKKKKTIEDSVDELQTNVTKNLTDLTKEMEKIRDEVSRKNRNDVVYKELANFKTDLDAIKGLLLNRKQFSSPIVPPSIPAWQLQSHKHHHHQQQQQQQQPDEVEVDKNDDCGSGSGSSETEVVTKNSDSSLELIS